MRLAEAQQLSDGLSDPLLRPALIEFFDAQRSEAVSALKDAVMCSTRDTMKESRIAGRADAYERAMSDLDEFARRAIGGINA